MQEALISLTERFGYAGIAFLIFIENVFPPLPSEGILLFGGYASYKAYLNIWGVIFSATAGSLLGAAVLYYCGYILGKERLKKLVSGRFWKAIHLSCEEIDKADLWFGRFGKKAVFICRCIPVLRSIVSIPAGISRMKPLAFFVLTAVGSFIWNSLNVWIGFLAGDAWQKASEVIGAYSEIILVACIALAVVIYTVYLFSKKNHKGSTVEK